MQPESFVPLTPNWGYNHRAVALRLPVSDNKDVRIEHRVAGADANPYLVVAAILAGIHYGITRQCEPTEMIAEGTIMDEQEITLPRRWDAALDRFRDSDILPEYLGEEFCEVYEIVRRSECERFHEQVSNLDYEWYLRGGVMQVAGTGKWRKAQRGQGARGTELNSVPSRVQPRPYR